MLNTLENKSFLELLPPNFRSDPDAIAAAAALDGSFQELIDQIEKCLVFVNISGITEEVLDQLAIDLHVDFYDTSLDLEVKQTLVQNSYNWHIHKGTPQVLEEVLQTVAGGAKVEEWFEYGGDPYYFKVDVDLVNQGLSETEQTLLNNLIQTYKNTRSHLEQLKIYLTSIGTAEIQTLALTGATISVFPYLVEELEIITNVPKVAVAPCYGTIISIFPEE